MQIEFSKTIQHITEDSGTEISPVVMWEAFQARVPARRRRATGSSATSCTPREGTHDGHRPGRRRRRAPHRHRRGQRPDLGVRARPARDVRRRARRRRLRRARHRARRRGDRGAYVETRRRGDDGARPAGASASTRHHDRRAQGRARRPSSASTADAAGRSRTWPAPSRSATRVTTMASGELRIVRSRRRRVGRPASDSMSVGDCARVEASAADRRTPRSGVRAPPVDVAGRWPPVGARRHRRRGRSTRSRTAPADAPCARRDDHRRRRRPSILVRRRRSADGRRPAPPDEPLRPGCHRRRCLPGRHPSRPTPTRASTTCPAGGSTTARAGALLRDCRRRRGRRLPCRQVVRAATRLPDSDKAR